MVKQLVSGVARRVNRYQSGGLSSRCRLRSNAPCGKLVDRPYAALIQSVVLKGSQVLHGFFIGPSDVVFCKKFYKSFLKGFFKVFKVLLLEGGCA